VTISVNKAKDIEGATINAKIVDASGDQSGTDANRFSVGCKDLDSNELLTLILNELRLIKRHNEKASNEVFTERDIDK